MERRAGTRERETYLVEHYGPGLTVDVFKQWAGRVRDAANAMEREGKPVRYLRSTIVPTDESLLCLLEAETEALVRATYARAGLPFERLSSVIPERDGGWAAMVGPREE
jgi:butyrate kinase